MKKKLMLITFAVYAMFLVADVFEDFNDFYDGSYRNYKQYYSSETGFWDTHNARCRSSRARSGNAINFNDDSSNTEELLVYRGMDNGGKDNGIGTISFWYRHYDGNYREPIEFVVEYQYQSLDGAWTQLGYSVVLSNDTNYHEYSYNANLPGDNIFIRIRTIQDKERLFIDDMSISDYSGGIAPLSIDFFSNSNLVTQSDFIQFSSNVTGGVPPYSYHWDFNNDGVIDSSIDNPVYSYSSEGYQSVKLLVNDSSGHEPSEVIKREYILVSDYYATVTATEGEDLRNQIHDIIDDHTSYSYYDNEIDEALALSDASPYSEGMIRQMYSGLESDSYDDVECVWNEYHGSFKYDEPVFGDLHNLKPADRDVSENGDRYDFDEGGSELEDAPGNFKNDNKDTFEPHDSVKGDVARILFYMDVRYAGDVHTNYSGEPNLVLKDYLDTDGNDDTGYGEYGRLSTLLQWHLEDPVDDFEIRRNNVIYSYQNNRNPFIDHPEWVEPIFFPTTSIMNIQMVLDFNNDASDMLGQYVKVQGYITAIDSNGFYLQDIAGGPWSGIYVSTDLQGYSVGDELIITAYVDEIDGVTSLVNIFESTLISTNNAISPYLISLAELSEVYESTLVQINDITVNPDDNLSDRLVFVSDSTGSGYIGSIFYNHGLNPGDIYQGIISVYINDRVQAYLAPRSEDDLLNAVNYPPIANAGDDIVCYDADEDGWCNITLNGSQSYDSDGSIGIWEWSWTENVNAGTVDEIFISEYYEGSSYRKAIELYNGTTSVIDLSNYTLERDGSGNGNFRYTLDLTGQVMPYSTFVIVYDRNGSNSDLAYEYDWDFPTSNNMMYFSGDDQIRLIRNDTGETIDFVGINGDVNWGRNISLIRKPEVYHGSNLYDGNEWEEGIYDNPGSLGNHAIGAKRVKRTVVQEYGETITHDFPLGITNVYLTVYDNHGASSVDTTRVMINEGNGSNPPVIYDVSYHPASPKHRQNITIVAYIDQNRNITNSELNWGLNAAQMTNVVPMQLIGNGEYRATINGQTAGSRVFFTVIAENDEPAEAQTAVQYVDIGYYGDSNIIFSEITEPSTSNAAFIELFNAGSAPVSLLDWEIRQYNSERSTVFNPDVNNNIVTNMDENFTLFPGEYLIVINGTLSNFSSYYGAYAGKYIVDGTTTDGVPYVDGGEYYELYDSTDSKGLADAIGSSTSTILNSHTYERIDAESDGSNLSSDWSDIGGDATGTPGAENQTLLNNDQSVLPVTFASFYCESTEDLFININWTTASEKDLSGFRILRQVMRIDDESDPDLSSAEQFNTMINASNDTNGSNYSFLDQEVLPGNKYFYWINTIEIDGQSTFYGPSVVVIDHDDILEEQPLALFTGLCNVYPNPFNPTARVTFSVKNPEEVKIDVFNLKGQKLKTLIEQGFDAGHHYVYWDGTDSYNKPVASGVYLFRMQAGKTSNVKKAMLLK